MEVKRESGMTNHTTRSTGRTRNDTSVAKRDIQSPIAQRQKSTKKMTTRTQRPPVVE